MIVLNFPAYTFRVLEKEGAGSIFDPVRKKYVALTPEEWVRQHVLRYLVEEKQVPLSLIRVEAEIRLFRTRKRVDLAVFDRNGNPVLIVECKAPSVTLNQAVLDQAVRYNMALKVNYLMITNGLRHIYCLTDPETGNTELTGDLPAFRELQKPADQKTSGKGRL